MSSSSEDDDVYYRDDITREFPYRKVQEKKGDVQIAEMYLLPGEGVPLEKHPKTSQVIKVEEGEATVVIDDAWRILTKGKRVTVEPRQRHGVYNVTDDVPLKMSFYYDPPEHEWGHVRIYAEYVPTDEMEEAIDFNQSMK